MPAICCTITTMIANRYIFFLAVGTCMHVYVSYIDGGELPDTELKKEKGDIRSGNKG